MRRWPLLAVLVLAACQPTPQPSPAPSPSVSPSTLPSSLPSLAAVPAAMLNPAVTQATIGQTICVAGWTATIRPPASYTTALKVRQLAAEHAADQNPADYEEDHWIPLELGGNPTAEANLWPELRVAAGGDAEKKDQAENAGKTAVCAGRESLAAAQLAMFTQWGPRS